MCAQNPEQLSFHAPSWVFLHAPYEVLQVIGGFPVIFPEKLLDAFQTLLAYSRHCDLRKTQVRTKRPPATGDTTVFNYTYVVGTYTQRYRDEKVNNSTHLLLPIRIAIGKQA